MSDVRYPTAAPPRGRSTAEPCCRSVIVNFMLSHLRQFFLILSTSLVNTAFAASSAFVVITPENEAEHPFSIEVNAVADHEQRSRVRIIGPVNGSQHTWLIICKKYLSPSRQNFRGFFWYRDRHKEIERATRLYPDQIRLPESGDKTYEHVEVELSHEHMRRAYIYIDYPFEVRDGGYYYSIDLAYYLEGSLGKKSVIEWETQ